MSGIFISHSSKNSAEAERLRDWLEEQGWGRSQVFLDLQDLKSGDTWRDVLNAMGDKEAVIVCLSNEWLGSHECVREFTQAQERGKPILPIFVAPVTTPIPRFITDLQIGDATKEDGFQSLRDGLLAKRITPQSFPWPPSHEPARSVYRGLQALDVQDAAVFFGRDADIARGLDELRRLRNAPQRLLVILGASGAGKSSFLRAGLIARLKRDEENFLVLPIVRPERAAMSGAQGLTVSVSAAMGRRIAFRSAADLAQAFGELRKPVMERLSRNAEAAREIYAAKPPTIVIPLDQAEELFSADNAERAKFCEIVSEAIAQDGNALLIATIRSDSYEALQNGLMPESQSTFSLPAVAAGSFKEIIEGPARLGKPPLAIEPAPTQQLLADLNASDALPMLAFTMERLQSQHSADGKLTLSDYREKLGGLSGAIQSAVNSVFNGSPTHSDLAQARRLFIPALVQVDQDGIKRRVARREDLGPASANLADRFVDQRILVSDHGGVEVAHEAILRQWPALSGWIAEERGSLATLDGVRAASREWRSHKDDTKKSRAESWLLHRQERLKDALSVLVRDDFSPVVDRDMRDYLAACHAAEKKSARGRRTLQLFAGVLLVIVLGIGWLSYQDREAQRRFEEAKIENTFGYYDRIGALVEHISNEDWCVRYAYLPSPPNYVSAVTDVQVREAVAIFDEVQDCALGGSCNAQLVGRLFTPYARSYYPALSSSIRSIRQSTPVRPAPAYGPPPSLTREVRVDEFGWGIARLAGEPSVPIDDVATRFATESCGVQPVLRPAPNPTSAPQVRDNVPPE